MEKFKLEVKFERIKTKLNAASSNTETVKEIIKTNQLVIFQWRLQQLILRKKNKDSDAQLNESPSVSLILTDVDILELLLTSGYVSEHRY